MMHLEAALERANLTGTMLDEPQLCYLYALAAMAPDGTAVECGVYKGGSLSVWAAAREGRGNVYAVDTWEGEAFGKARLAFDKQMESCSLSPRVLTCNSWQAASLVEPLPVAFVFIDAHHGEGGVDYDMASWPKAIAPGGILVLHDYNVGDPTIIVKRVVDKWMQEAKWHYLGLVGSAIAFMRPRSGERIGGTK